MSELARMTTDHTLVVLAFYTLCLLLSSGILVGLSLKYAEDNDEAFAYMFIGVLVSICLSFGPTYWVCKALGYFQ